MGSCLAVLFSVTANVADAVSGAMGCFPKMSAAQEEWHWPWLTIGIYIAMRLWMMDLTI